MHFQNVMTLDWFEVMSEDKRWPYKISQITENYIISLQEMLQVFTPEIQYSPLFTELPSTFKRSEP
jgi:hypothetical protein